MIWALIGCSSTSLGDFDDLEVTVSALVHTTVALSWTTPSAGQSWIEHGLVDQSLRRTDATAITADHEIRLTGLKPGATTQWQAFTELQDGTLLQTSTNFLEIPPVPDVLPRLQRVEAASDATVTSGFVVTTLIEADGGWAVVLDGEGDIVWWYDTGHAGSVPPDLVGSVPPAWDGHSLPITARVDPTTHSLLVAFYDGQQQIDVGTLRRIPLDAMSADEIVTTRTELAHHDFVYHPDDGRVSWLAYQVAGPAGAQWASDAVLQIDEGATSSEGVTPVWSWLDDFDVAPFVFDDLQTSFPSPIADLEWTHSNSLMYVAESDAFFVMSKFLDCLAKIDATTGTLQWVLGGMYSDFTDPGGAAVWSSLSETSLWSHGHMSDLWHDPVTGTGGFVVFDNGYYYPGRFEGDAGWSRVSTYTFDEGTRIVEKTWEYAEPDGGFTPLMGDVRSLPDGDLLIGWSTLGRIEELTPDHDVVWRVETSLGTIVGRVSFLPTL